MRRYSDTLKEKRRETTAKPVAEPLFVEKVVLEEKQRARRSRERFCLSFKSGVDFVDTLKKRPVRGVFYEEGSEGFAQRRAARRAFFRSPMGKSTALRIPNATIAAPHSSS